MNLIFHEKQEGFLCAQHCLNALLQNSYFTAVELASLANELDELERRELALAGLESLDYVNLVENGSQNMDDSGFFSIQVISKALAVWGLELRALHTHEITTSDILLDKNAFICHFKQHWFTIRKLGLQWFNLNSLLSGPELITETYLCMYLTQLQHEGYSIFLVSGTLPHSEADEILKENPIIQSHSRHFSSPSTHNAPDGNDLTLKQAIEESIRESEINDPTLQQMLYETDDKKFDQELQAAMKLSLGSTTDPANVTNERGVTSSVVQIGPGVPSREDIRARRQKFLDQLSNQ